MCVYMYVCIHAYVSVRIYTLTYNMLIYITIYIHIKYVNTPADIRTNMLTYTNTCIYTNINNKYILTYMHTNIHSYIIT